MWVGAERDESYSMLALSTSDCYIRNQSHIIGETLTFTSASHQCYLTLFLFKIDRALFLNRFVRGCYSKLPGVTQSKQLVHAQLP